MSNLPEPVERAATTVTPDLMRAAVSPAAVALTAVGAGIGVLDHSAVLAVVLAVVGWGGRMGAALVGRARRRRAAQPKPPVLDPWSVPEPWRQLVEQAAAARLRFDQVLATWPAGPTRDELLGLQPQLWAHVGEVGILAQRGAAADGWTGATFAAPNRADGLESEMGQLQREKVRFAGTERAATAEAREAVVAAQLREVRRQEGISYAIRDRLRTAVTRLDATVVDLVAVLPGSGPQPTDPGEVARAIDDLSDRLSTLRSALTESARADRALTEGGGSTEGNPTA